MIKLQTRVHFSLALVALLSLASDACKCMQPTLESSFSNSEVVLKVQVQREIDNHEPENDNRYFSGRVEEAFKGCDDKGPILIHHGSHIEIGTHPSSASCGVALQARNVYLLFGNIVKEERANGEEVPVFWISSCTFWRAFTKVSQSEKRFLEKHRLYEETLCMCKNGDCGPALTIKDLPKIHVDSLSIDDFDTLYLDQQPIILEGVTTCPASLDLQNIGEHCNGAVRGNYIRTRSRSSPEWAGLQQGNADETVNFLEYVHSMGTNDELRFMFDVPMLEICPSLLPEVRLPPHFVNAFASQHLRRHLSDDDPAKCQTTPFFNMYLAEAGFETDLHIDAAHTAFVASMCVGRKRWRVLSPESFALRHADLVWEGSRGHKIKDKWVMSEIQRPFPTWNDKSPLYELDGVLYEGILEPGQILYIPPGAPHAAVTMDQSLMVASNDQTMQSLTEIVEYCTVDTDWFGCDRFRHRLPIIQENWERFAGYFDRVETSFAETFGCGKIFKQLSRRRLEITPENFVTESAKGPIIVMKYARSCISCLQLFDRIEESFTSEVRFAVLNCPLGECPKAQGLYQQILTMSREEPPEFVFVATRDGALNVAHYYGPLHEDFILVWIANKVGHYPSSRETSLWWSLFVHVYLGIIDATAACLRAVGIPPMADDVSVICMLLLLTAIVPCIGICCCTEVADGDKRKDE